MEGWSFFFLHMIQIKTQKIIHKKLGSLRVAFYIEVQGQPWSNRFLQRIFKSFAIFSCKATLETVCSFVC